MSSEYYERLRELEKKAEAEEKTYAKDRWAKEASRFLGSKEWKLARGFVFEHFGKICVRCGSTDNIHLDHIYPRVKDPKGSTWLAITNLQPLCSTCNVKIKGTKSTDYRQTDDKIKALNLKSEYALKFKEANLDLIWEAFAPEKAVKLLEAEVKKQWCRDRSAITRIISERLYNSSFEYSTVMRDEIIEKLGIYPSNRVLGWTENAMRRRISILNKPKKNKFRRRKQKKK